MTVSHINKLAEDGETIFFDEIRLSSGGSLKFKDKRGFVIMELKEDGSLYLKGKRIKI